MLKNYNFACFGYFYSLHRYETNTKHRSREIFFTTSTKTKWHPDGTTNYPCVCHIALTGINELKLRACFFDRNKPFDGKCCDDENVFVYDTVDELVEELIKRFPKRPNSKYGITDKQVAFLKAQVQRLLDDNYQRHTNS